MHFILNLVQAISGLSRLQIFAQKICAENIYRRGIFMSKKLIALVLAILILVPMLFGGFTQPTSAKASISVVVGSEPATIDPNLSETVDGGIYILHAFEGLTRVSMDKKTIPGVAYKWEVSKDLLTYTFHLRSSKWSDGKAVKASDFVYSWKRALDPKTASTYAFQLYYIKGAEAYNTGKGAEKDVAIVAVDDKTLKVTLKSPCSYFLDLVRTPTFMPLRKDIIAKYGATWTQNPKTYIGNGTYVMSKWTHNSELVYTKSNTYWDKGTVLLKELRFKLTDDDTACLNAFETGALDLVDGLIPQAEIGNLLAKKIAKTYTQVGTYYLYINNAVKPFNDVRVRKALSLAIDRNYIVKKVTKAGEKPAVGIVPYDVPGLKKTFREEAPVYIKPTAQIKEAQKLLADAGFPGGKGFPEDVEIFYNTQSGHKAIMEAVMEQWKQNLGITIKSPNMEWKVLTERVNSKDYTLTRMGWIGDYNDPMTFVDMFTTGNGQNKINFSNAQYDKLVRTAQNSGDQKVRMDAMRKAEGIFLNDAAVIPLYYYVFKFLESPKLKGHIVDPLGFVYFMHAYTKK
jgi:oligopeptide transport system substrate-binding protein